MKNPSIWTYVKTIVDSLLSQMREISLDITWKGATEFFKFKEDHVIILGSS